MSKNKDTMTCLEASKALALSVPTIKQGLITGSLPIGVAIPPRDIKTEGVIVKGKWTFLISKKAVDNFILGNMSELLMPEWIKKISEFYDSRVQGA